MKKIIYFLFVCVGAFYACKDEEHCYYRVYADGRQIASTAAESLTLGDKRKGNLYEVFSVDKWGNCRK